MNTKVKELTAYGIWLFLYVLCVGLGAVENVTGAAKVFFVLTSLIFFLPGAYLLYLANRQKNRKICLRVRIVAIVSLALTVAVFSGNVIAVSSSSAAGKILYDLLNLVSAPMFCSQYWILSLFCWACLLSASFMKKTEN
jgi:hypothetical protein